MPGSFRPGGVPAGLAALFRGPGVHLQGRMDITAGLESLLSFFVILFMVFDDLEIDC